MKDPSQQAAAPEWKQLLRLGERLVDQPTPAAQCSQIVETVSQMLAAQVRVWLASPIYPLPGSPAMETLPEAEATPLAHLALAEGKSQCQPPVPDPGAAQTGPVSVAVPLVANQAMLGVVQADRPDGPPFTERELSLLEGLIAHAAIAMEIARQETLKNWRLDQLSLVRSVNAQIANLTNFDQLYNRVTRLIQETFNYYYVAVFTLDEPHGVLCFRGSASQSPSEPLQNDFRVRLGEGLVGAVGASGTEIIAPDVRQEARYRYLDLLPETRSEAAIPLKIENRILGVLDVQSDKLRAFHEIDMLVLRALADTLALAIESTHLYTSLERRAEQISSVFEVSHALSSILDLDELLAEVVRLIQNRFGFPFVHVFTVHTGRRLVIYQAGTGERSQAMKQQGRHYALDDLQGLIPRAARTGQTILANDVTLEPNYRPADLPPYDTRAELTVPLVAGEEVVGVLDIQSREVNAFDENDRSLFEALAAPIAIAIRNANLYRSEQWRRKVAESFRDVAHMITNNQPVNQLLDLILEKLEGILPCDVSAIWLLPEDKPPDPGSLTHGLRLGASRNLDAGRLFEVLQDPPVQQMLNQALAVDYPLIRRPEDPAGPLGAALGFDANYSSIAAPMRTGERSLGILTLAHHQNGRYGSEAQAITATFASYAAVALKNTRLYRESQEQALVSTMLLQVAEASQTIMTVEDLLSTMIRLTRLLVGVKKCAFLVEESEQPIFTLKAWYGFEPTYATPRTFSTQMPALKKMMADRAPLTLTDPAVELTLPELSLNPGPGTVMMLPLLVRGRVTGAFLVGMQTAEAQADAAFDPKILAILQGITHQTAMTIDNLQLLEARQEEAYVTAALLQVSQAVVSSNDLNDTLDTIVQLMPILAGIETSVIYLWDASTGLFRPTQVHASSRREEEIILSQPFSPQAHRLLGAVQSSGTLQMCPIPVPDLAFEDWAALDCRPYPAANEPASLSGDWVLGYPLALQGQVLGVLLVRERNTSATFWEQRLEIIHGIAQQASLAIQNDLLKQELVENERIEREIQLARQIQETFLPDRLPELPGWDLDLRWETAREVGGDFYDLFKLEDNRYGLVIADVSDKGLPAALYMTVARTLIRANAASGRPPAEVLEDVNQLLLNDSSESMFITAVYATLTPETGELVYANAGHNRPLLHRAGADPVEELPKGGTALGILTDLQLENHRLQINPGDLLVLFTDGVTDILSPEGEMFGQRRLMALVQQSGNERAQDTLEQLDDAMIEFRRGTPPVDDITLLAIRRAPEQPQKAARKKGGRQNKRQPGTAG